MADLLGLSISVGLVSKAERRADAMTAGPVAEVTLAITKAEALNVDETGWHQAGKRAWLWSAVAKGMTLFRVDASRGAAALRRLGGEAIAPTITSDRYSTYEVVRTRQVCLAHTIRTQSTNRPGAWLLLGSASHPIARPLGPIGAGA